VIDEGWLKLYPLSSCCGLTGLHLVSMVSAEWLDLLERIAREVRQNTKPFGGMQVRELVGKWYPLITVSF
jgi:hypothetical protein